MAIKRHILAAEMAIGLGFAILPAASFAVGDEQSGHHMSAEDRAALLDARIAALKTGLTLTAEQEKNWAPLEAAIRDRAKERAERIAAWREKQGDHEQHGDLMERLQHRSERMMQRAGEIEKLIGAAKPLYDSLDDGQKRRFAELMRAAGGHHHHWRHEG